MDFAVENRTVGLIGTSTGADRIADSLALVGIDVARMPKTCPRGRPARHTPDAVVVVSDDLAETAAARRRWKEVPIITVTDIRDLKARALCLCADDAVSCHVEIEELVVRVAVAIRRAERTARHEEPAAKTAGDLVLDEDRHALVVRDQRIRLTPRQVSIMSVLRSHVEHNPIPLSRIYQAVCATDTRAPNHETIRVHISMLNKKLASVAGAGVRIRCSQDGYYVQAAA